MDVLFDYSQEAFVEDIPRLFYLLANVIYIYHEFLSPIVGLHKNSIFHSFRFFRIFLFFSEVEFR